MRFAEVSAEEGSSREEGRRDLPGEPGSRAAPALNFEQTDFCQSDPDSNLVLMRRCVVPDNPEFSLHVHKLMGNAHRPALFTIAIWEGTVLRGICYAQPLDAALAAFRKVLDQWGREAMGEEVCLDLEVR